MKNKKTDDQKLSELLEKWNELSYNFTIISASIQYKKSQELIEEKIKKEKLAIAYGIDGINKKVLENLKKYPETEKELNSIISKYENNLLELSELYDCQIVQGYAKMLAEEKKQSKIYEEIYELLEKEKVAKKKVDNSDDEIREKICNLEDEISKIELKLRRLRTTIKKKIEEKNDVILKAMETKEQQIQRDIKGPRVFDKAKRFFLGKINPYKMIEKNVFSNIKNRIEMFEKDEITKLKKANSKYKAENIIKTLSNITEEELEITEEKG